MRTRRLIVVTPEGERELLFVGRLMVGRAPECDISLADTKISRRHAEFDATGPTPRVTDLGSRNGILVNGRRVGAADLAPGDVVTAGDARIRFEERPETSVPAGSALASTADDRTAVLMPPSGSRPAESSGATPIRGASLDPDKTSVLPPPAGPSPRPASAFAPVPPPGLLPAPPPEPPSAALPLSGHESADHTLMLSAPPRGPAPPSAPAVAPPSVAPAAARPGAPAGAALGRALRSPRFSWVGFVTLAAMALGSLAVLLGSLLGPFVAFIVTLGLAMLTAMLITRQARATLQHFTQQVELVVSGASPNEMQGGLMPGLDRLAGVVTDLLARKRGVTSGYGAGPSLLFETDDPDLGPPPPAVPFDPGPR